MLKIFLSTVLLTFAGTAFAFEVPPNDGYVTDIANVLSLDQESALESDLTAYQNETSNEIAILIVETLEGESIADAAVEIGRKWGVGQADFNNGIMIVIAYADRKLFIATGYGMEGAVPDIVAKGIIDEDITPYFKQGKYFEGISAGISALKKHIGGEYTAERFKQKKSDGSGAAWIFFVCFILLQWLSAIFARTKSWWLGGIVGAVAGIILVMIYSWWISIPILALIGFLLDYAVSQNYKKNRGKASWWAMGNAGGGDGRGARVGWQAMVTHALMW